MPGFGHGPVSSEREDPAIAARNARVGLWLFAFYFLLYATFVGLNSFQADLMARPIFGVSLAVLYGMSLIISALLLALLYTWMCRGGSGKKPTLNAGDDR